MPDTPLQTPARRLEFSDAAEKRLQVIMDRVGTNNVGEILRKALRLYEWAVEEVEVGKRICAIDSDGKGECIDIHAGYIRHFENDAYCSPLADRIQ